MIQLMFGVFSSLLKKKYLMFLICKILEMILGSENSTINLVFIQYKYTIKRRTVHLNPQNRRTQTLGLAQSMRQVPLRRYSLACLIKEIMHYTFFLNMSMQLLPQWENQFSTQLVPSTAHACSKTSIMLYASKLPLMLNYVSCAGFKQLQE